MSITKCPGHMRSLKLNLRTRAPFDRCVGDRGDREHAEQRTPDQKECGLWVRVN